ncbi:hypothetical protein GCM10017653_25710 [Ancylobacter defluvii]|uniref:Uncharacterized protein n=1 Tax=Ancylobacter defluvii TaxID=1282440 RepID=A0A9W6JXQ7_9HYPH|nr:hypothetical protein GCM10017653_25710 [Ancylobacter defluvii]
MAEAGCCRVVGAAEGEAGLGFGGEAARGADGEERCRGKRRHDKRRSGRLSRGKSLAGARDREGRARHPDPLPVGEREPPPCFRRREGRSQTCAPEPSTTTLVPTGTRL